MTQLLIKDLKFDQECRDTLISGVKQLAKAVKSTLGVMGANVLIESPQHTNSITVTKDGWTVAKSINLINPVEDMANRIVREAAEKTATYAGDGTTTSIVIAEALILLGNEKIKEGINKTQVLRYMTEICGDIIEELKAKSIPVTDDYLYNVATISANNDENIGRLIADAYKSVGKSGIISFNMSMTSETYSEVTNGLRIDRGYASPLFINNRVKDECIMEDVHILVCDTEISDIPQIEPVLKEIYPTGKKLLIIAPCSQNVLSVLVANALTTDPTRKKLNVCVVNPPSFGFRQHELMEDIAVSIGATYFSQQTGDDLSHVTFNSLGYAKKVIIGKDKTEIIGSHGDDSVIKERVSQLVNSRELANKKEDKDFINERIASLSGGVGVIYVGGNTDLEQKELYDRVDDAVRAVRSALEEGVLSGAGKALFEIEIDRTGNAEYEIAKDIVLNAIKVPLIQILDNAHMDYKTIYKNLPKGVGYNLKTGKVGNLVEMGVIDPLKVTRTALQNAVSVAVTILSTNASVSITRA